MKLTKNQRVARVRGAFDAGAVDRQTARLGRAFAWPPDLPGGAVSPTSRWCKSIVCAHGSRSDETCTACDHAGDAVELGE